MHPLRRQSGGDRMLAVAGDDLERSACTVVAGGPRRGIGNQFAILVIPVGPRFFVAAQPAAQADHQVVLGPVWKRIVCGVETDEPSAVLHPLLKPRTDLGGPLVAGWKFVVV